MRTSLRWNDSRTPMALVGQDEGEGVDLGGCPSSSTPWRTRRCSAGDRSTVLAIAQWLPSAVVPPCTSAMSERSASTKNCHEAVPGAGHDQAWTAALSVDPWEVRAR